MVMEVSCESVAPQICPRLRMMMLVTGLENINEVIKNFSRAAKN